MSVDPAIDTQSGDATGSSPVADPTPNGVMHLVAHHAALAGACEFIPLPFADDLAAERFQRALVDKVLNRHGRELDASALRPLYAGPNKSLLGRAGGFFKGLVLKPVKKLFRTVLIVFTIRRAVLTCGEALLIGRTLDRLLGDGWFRDDQSDDALTHDATRVGVAVRGVMMSPERRGLVRLLRQGMRWMRDDSDGDADDTEASPPASAADDDAETHAPPMDRRQRAKVTRAGERLRQELDSQEGRGVLAGLDAAVDRRLA